MTSSIAAVLINLVALPFYLRFLGLEAYGLIGFYVTLQAVMQVLDLGFGPTISREVARGTETGLQRRSASLLRTLEVVYCSVAVFIALSVVIAAPVIAGGWLQQHALPDTTVVQAVALMGISLAIRWPIGLYHCALAGAHRLAWSSAASMVFNLSGAAFTIAALGWLENSVQVFFIVQACVGLLHVVLLRSLALRVLGNTDAPRDFPDLLRVWRFTAWMGGLGAAGLLLSHIDKLVLSRILDLEAYGQYMLATLLASGLGVLTFPVYSALYPQFSSLIARNDLVNLEHLYGVSTRLFSIALFALASLLVFQSQPLLSVWLRDTEVAASVAPIAALLALGSAINGVMHLPYTLQLASGRSRLAFLIAAALLVIMVPLTLVLAWHFGTRGGALAWLLLNAIYTIVGTWLTGRAGMSFAGWTWLWQHVIRPVAVTMLPPLFAAWLCRELSIPPLAAVGAGLLAALVGMALGLFVAFSASELRQAILAAPGRSLSGQKEV